MSIRTIAKRVYLTWMLASSMILLVVAVSRAGVDVAPIAGATSHVLTQARDLGIIGGIVIAFMLIISSMMVGMAWFHDRASKRTADAISAQSFSSAQSLHNLMQHNLEMAQKADARIEKVISFLKGRPCFMATDALDLLHAQNRARHDLAMAAVRAADRVDEAALKIVEDRP